jgi:hypothetical protein
LGDAAHPITGPLSRACLDTGTIVAPQGIEPRFRADRLQLLDLLAPREQIDDDWERLLVLASVGRGDDDGPSFLCPSSTAITSNLRSSSRARHNDWNGCAHCGQPRL